MDQTGQGSQTSPLSNPANSVPGCLQSSVPCSERDFEGVKECRWNRSSSERRQESQASRDVSLIMDHFKFFLSLNTFFWVKYIDGTSCYSNAAGSRADAANHLCYI